MYVLQIPFHKNCNGLWISFNERTLSLIPECFSYNNSHLQLVDDQIMSHEVKATSSNMTKKT